MRKIKTRKRWLGSKGEGKVTGWLTIVRAMNGLSWITGTLEGTKTMPAVDDDHISRTGFSTVATSLEGELGAASAFSLAAEM